MSDLQKKSRLFWALSISFALHMSVAAAYVLVPALRSWWLMRNSSPPTFEFGFGVPDFIEIEEIPGEDETSKAPEETPPETPEETPPEVVETPPVQEEPDPDAITIPTSLAASTQPASEPTTIVATQPASEPSSGRSGVPLQATALVDSLPTSAKMLILISNEPMRKSPRREVLGRAMRNIYDAERTFGHAGIDPFEDIDEILVGTSNPWSLMRWAFIVRYQGTEEELKAQMERTAARDGDTFVWKEIAGAPVAERAKEMQNSDHYAFAFLAPQVLAIALPPTLTEFLRPKTATSSPSSAPVVKPKIPKRSVSSAVEGERGSAPAILFAVSDLERVLPLDVLTTHASGGVFSIDWGESRTTLFGKITLPKAPLYFRMGIEVGEGALSTFEARFENEEDARDAVQKFPNVRGWLVKLAPDELKPTLERLEFYQTGETIHADLEIEPEEVGKILQGLSPLLMGDVVVPVEGDLGEPASKPAPESPVRPSSTPPIPSSSTSKPSTAPSSLPSLP